ncbi:MAG: PH domain-containing protein [candidate division Zixibacteria bacterium]|nr:PH domain-containing protein [candidate division Zixibacteria bacterium]
MSSEVLYTSKSTTRSLWQEYRIYEDHVEFATHLGLVSIPLDAIENVDVQESDVKGLLKGDLRLKNFKPAIKIDWANFLEHVVLDRNEGFCKRFLFTPENPSEFKEVLDKLLAAHKQR